MEVFCKAELLAIEQYHKQIIEEQGRDVDFDIDAQEWIQHRSVGWHQERQTRMLAMQREEINRYKWIESEKAQRDLGREAVLCWIRENAAAWRRWYEEEYEVQEYSQS